MIIYPSIISGYFAYHKDLPFHVNVMPTVASLPNVGIARRKLVTEEVICSCARTRLISVAARRLRTNSRACAGKSCSHYTVFGLDNQ